MPAALLLLIGVGALAVYLASSGAFTSTAAPAAPAPAAAGPQAQPNPGGGTVVGLVTYGDLRAVRPTWTDQQISAWANIIRSESNGTLTDTNPSSGAYGIAQGITGPGWYAQHGGSPDTVIGQLTAMANYIQQRYGDPVTAWMFHLAHNWY